MSEGNFDKLDCMLIAALCENDMRDDIELFESLDVSQVVFSKNFEKKRNALIKREKTAPRRIKNRKILFRIVLAVMIILSVAFITIMSVSAFRRAVVDVVVEFYNDHIKVSCEERNSEPWLDNNDYSYKMPIRVNDKKSIRSLDSKNATKETSNNDVSNTIVYYKDDKRVCSFYQSVLCDNDVYFDSDGRDTKVVNINGNNAILVETNKGVCHVTWSDGEYFYVITCYDLSYDIVQLARSVR